MRRSWGEGGNRLQLAPAIGERAELGLSDPLAVTCRQFQDAKSRLPRTHVHFGDELEL